MPSSLTTLLPSALGFSPHLPVSVCGTGPFLRLFSPPLSSASLLDFGPFRPGQPTPGSDYGFVSAFFGGSHGISTVCASTTPSGLALAPDLPRADEPSPGNLRFSAITILTQFALLIPAFSLLYSPHPLSMVLHPVQNAPLPSITTARASVIRLAPLNLRRSITRLVSCYALFQ